MKLLTTLLALTIFLLLFNIFELKKERQHYRSNLSRQEMRDLLMQVTGRDIAVFIPGDTTVMPYLVKDEN